MAQQVKNLPVNVGDTGDVGSIAGLGRSPGGGNGSPLQHSCLKKSHGERSLVGYSPWGLYIFGILTSTWACHLQISSPFSMLPLCFVNGYLHCSRC